MLLILSSSCASAQSTSSTGNLFLLAGTPTISSNANFPANLYTVNAHRKLKLVRVVVPAQDGLYAVLDDLGSKIYVLYPGSFPRIVSIIHKERPAEVDEIDFSSIVRGMLSSQTTFEQFEVNFATPFEWRLGVGAGTGSQSYALIPFSLPHELVSVSGDVSAHAPRVLLNRWHQYRSFRYEGFAGGPDLFSYSPLMTLIPHDVVMRMTMDSESPSVELNTAPPGLQVPEGRAWWPVQIIVASRRFFAFDVPPGGGGPTPPIPLYVYDRELDRWRAVNFPANAPRSRIFGRWLATILVNYAPGANVHPGSRNERDWGSASLPNVRQQYSAYDKYHSAPGKLLLDNLVDGRRITLNTHEEDSEILDVRDDGLALYRVNDEIFSARIEGDKLSAPTLVVKDKDVPEVHWAFWSNARPEPAPIGKPTAKR